MRAGRVPRPAEVRYPAEVDVRPLTTDPADLAAAYEVADACERAAVGESETTREDVRALVEGPGTALEACRLATVDGRAAGLLVVEVDSEGRDVFVDAYVDPAAPDGLLAALVADGVVAAYATAEADPAPGPGPDADLVHPCGTAWQVDAGAFAADEPYREVLLAHGLVPARRFWRMRIDLGENGIGPQAPPPPSGVTIEVARDADHTRLLHELFVGSFGEHWGTVVRPYQEWITMLGATPGADPDRWYVIRLHGRPAALLVLDDSRAELGDGYVRTLGVLPWARGRGLARWLLHVAFADAAARGHTGVALTVDSENTTGATRLYEGVGMRPIRVIDAFRGTLDPAEP
ncbi:MAG: GNAT family N-acetyltransferase [Candidatus Nanopelagicales bacterium]